MSRRYRTYCMLAENLDTGEIVGYFDDYYSSFHDYRASKERVFIRQAHDRGYKYCNSKTVLAYFDKQKEVFKNLLGEGNWKIFISNVNSSKCPITLDWDERKKVCEKYHRGRNSKDRKHSRTGRENDFKIVNLRFCVK